MQAPRAADDHRPTAPASPDALASQVLSNRALGIEDEVVGGTGNTLASAGLALMGLAVRAYRENTLGWEHDAQWRLVPPVGTTILLPTLRQSLRALLKAPPRAYEWCRTRWSCATLALTLQATRGITVSAETVRRWLHEIGWVWKRAKLVAKDDDPQRVEHLARIRFVVEQLKLCKARVFADELDIHLLPKVGCAWMPTGPKWRS